MNLKPEDPMRAPAYPPLRDYYRLHRCGFIKTAVVAGSLAVLGSAGAGEYHLIKTLLEEPAPAQQVALVGIIAMPQPPAQPPATSTSSVSEAEP